MSTTSSTQTILPTPLRSLLRKMSTNTVMANQIQMIQKKKTRNDQKTWPSPKAASTGIPLEYCFRVGLPRGSGQGEDQPQCSVTRETSGRSGFSKSQYRQATIRTMGNA